MLTRRKLFDALQSSVTGKFVKDFQDMDRNTLLCKSD